MPDKQLIAYLRYVHASYNTLMMCLFIYQGVLGLKIRRARKRGEKPPVSTIKRHRQDGPLLALLGVLGFFAGVTLIFLDYGRLLKYPVHFIMGLIMALSITATFIISKKIEGPESAWRNAHFRLGVLILSMYPVQVFLGIGILF
ncbi:MAG: DUF4079 family protein [Nitrospiraceae bacterium]|nr:MAG: DUF4079 family protein [Nitrospiraceae bacterium]